MGVFIFFKLFLLWSPLHQSASWCHILTFWCWAILSCVPKLVSKICRAKPLPSANFGKHHSDIKTKLKLSVPAEEVQLLIMGVKVLLELLWAHEATVALITRPVLLLLSENYIPSEMLITAFQSPPIKCFIFFSQAFLSSVGHISPLKVRQTAEYPAQLHLALLLSPLHCDMTAAHCRNTKRSLGKIHMDSIHCLKFKKILK